MDTTAWQRDDQPDEEQRLCVQLMLVELGAEEASLYELFYRQRLPIAAIARLTGTAEGTIKYRLFALRKKLLRLR
ncbi:MAG: hypothetical protein A2087_08620 [Spirochaetes bacterium GWD1_61_31]|nr:MAG: hypothetical protein A2Y37_09845 [Spirochaetes bacterium GWB1_60_80]OHD29872.1 MAG: hypothetical protein A2004_09800 [Spirochaetes bacterium GWC1_61_12]OHD39791.1 MAG: hypothetical protein A2087_08620 [Spirochaetes bacterium GWD1_61_31]OHD44730.1 MAG: hypothetical protein A2Y35_01055 [Spirochaetes bacterium GWE1_60_18]OHD59913.1 MAG: hypothetical protein A2Y32_15000 [Spirochaetes bacterium GWF1_60_12]